MPFNCSFVKVILEIGLTYRHRMIVFQPHWQELGLNILLSQPRLNEGDLNFPIVQYRT